MENELKQFEKFLIDPGSENAKAHLVFPLFQKLFGSKLKNQSDADHWLLRMSAIVFDTFPWPQYEMRSATVPVAESGVAPDSSPAQTSSAKKSDERGFQRDAENNRRDARAPQTVIAKIDAVAAAAR